jgi:hypothetical protein
MTGLITALCIWALITTVYMCIVIHKVNLNEKRIMVIHDYLQKRIKRETGQTAYKDVR